jgi:hypothetical protein
MTLLNEASITEWVSQLKRQEILCILSGFTPGNPPGVATFYLPGQDYWVISCILMLSVMVPVFLPAAILMGNLPVTVLKMV